MAKPDHNRAVRALALRAAAGLALSAMIAGAAAAHGDKLVSYQKDSGVGLGAFGGKLAHSYGYKDKKLANGNWQVTGQAKSDDAVDSQMIALYRAAELAKAEGKGFIEIVSINDKALGAIVSGMPSMKIAYGTRNVYEVALTDTADATAHCASDVLQPSCRSIEVAAVLREIGPRLKIKNKGE